MTTFDSVYSTTLGFDKLFYNAETFFNNHDKYPHHNIVKVDDHNYLIELAVAGFAREELDVVVKDRSLRVVGKHENRGRDYIHRGISTKRFEKNFRLSEYVQVNGADLTDGILAIQLEVVVPEEMRPRQIEINSNSRGLTHDNTGTTETHFLTEDGDQSGN